MKTEICPDCKLGDFFILRDDELYGLIIRCINCGLFIYKKDGKIITKREKE